MMMDAQLINTLLLGGITVVTLGLIIVLLRTRSYFQKRTEQSESRQIQLQEQLIEANKQILEMRSLLVGVGHGLSDQQDISKALTERVQALELADVDDKLYSRASKMVKLGADVDELVQECELPQAEAELMRSLQNKITGKESIPPLENKPRRRPNIKK
ncbi:DUF2802 domain-containing protein [Vibrio sp.]|nr:DUF2802 domain-containing protein [Vibrio sp.]